MSAVLMHCEHLPGYYDRWSRFISQQQKNKTTKAEERNYTIIIYWGPVISFEYRTIQYIPWLFLYVLNKGLLNRILVCSQEPITLYLHNLAYWTKRLLESNDNIGYCCMDEVPSVSHEIS